MFNPRKVLFVQMSGKVVTALKNLFTVGNMLHPTIYRKDD